MTTLRLIIPLLASLPLVVGCADYQAEFVNDERVATLATTSPDAANNLKNSLDAHFGTPNALVAWGALPIEFGEIGGTVISANGNSLRVSLEIEPPDGLSNVAVVVETETPQNRTAGSYNADTRTLTLLEQEAAPAIAPGTSLRLIGHKLQAGRRLYMQHCMHCHGVTGDGNGPTARYIRKH